MLVLATLNTATGVTIENTDGHSFQTALSQRDDLHPAHAGRQGPTEIGEVSPRPKPGQLYHKGDVINMCGKTNDNEIYSDVLSWRSDVSIGTTEPALFSVNTGCCCRKFEP